MTNQTKLVDFVAAFITALSLWCLSLGLIIPDLLWRLLPYHVKFAFAGVCCFAVVTLLTFLIPEKLRTHIGWLIIAVLGLVLSAYVKELIQRATETEPDFFEAFSPFPFEIFLFLLPSLALMGITHYLGVRLFSAKRRNKLR
jgi:hypothetical protein